VWVAIGELTPWDKNPRNNDGTPVEEVAKSIKRWGFGAPILARKENGEVIAGHTRLKAARSLGLERVPVRYLDLDPVEAHLLALADNRLGELATWDDEALAEILRDARTQDLELDGLGWDDDALADLLADGVALPGSGDDDAPAIPVPEEPESKLGEVYQLGPHRLICGDSTDSDVWSALLGDEQLQMVWTDPPYGVSYESSGSKPIANDEKTGAELTAFLLSALSAIGDVATPGSAFYVASPSGPRVASFVGALWSLGLGRWALIWVKDQFVMGRADYHNRHEVIWYGWKRGTRLPVADRRQNTVFEIPRPKASAEHPTMKPVELIAPMIENSSKPGWLVGDGFGGSGSTLIASAMTGRRARLVELDPGYCDVIRRRWGRWAADNGQNPGEDSL
jgi:DNA modification methylase